MELPQITQKEYEILKEHWAGKRHTFICRKHNITKPQLYDLIEKTANGYTIKR